MYVKKNDIRPRLFIPKFNLADEVLINSILFLNIKHIIEYDFLMTA